MPASSNPIYTIYNDLTYVLCPFITHIPVMGRIDLGRTLCEGLITKADCDDDDEVEGPPAVTGKGWTGEPANPFIVKGGV